MEFQNNIKRSGQRVFDTNNSEDMDLFWSILPEEIVKIRKFGDYVCLVNKEKIQIVSLLKIDMQDKTEIVRPIDESKLIGELGWFSDYTDGSYIHFDRLKDIRESSQGKLYLGENMIKYTKYFRLLTLEEWISMKPASEQL